VVSWGFDVYVRSQDVAGPTVSHYNHSEVCILCVCVCTCVCVCVCVRVNVHRLNTAAILVCEACVAAGLGSVYIGEIQTDDSDSKQKKKMPL